MEDFRFSFDKVSLEGALFDIGKLNFFSKELLALMNKCEISEAAYEYAKQYCPELKELIERDKNYFMDIMNIEREKENPRKDYYRFSDLASSISFFYDDLYRKTLDEEPLPFNSKFNKETIIEVLGDLKDKLPYDNVDEQTWFAALKDIALEHKFAPNNKTLKANPEQYIGLVADVAEMLRITITTRKNSPNLFYVLQVIGKERSNKRIEQVILLLQK